MKMKKSIIAISIVGAFLISPVFAQTAISNAALQSEQKIFNACLKTSLPLLKAGAMTSCLNKYPLLNTTYKTCLKTNSTTFCNTHVLAIPA